MDPNSNNSTNTVNWNTLSIQEYLKLTKPNFRNPFDAVAVALHFTMRKMGFRCVGCGENLETDPSALLPSSWNQYPDSYSFRYRHPQSSMNFLIKAITLGENLLIHGLAIEDNKPRSFEINVSEYVNKNSLTDYENVYKDFHKLIGLFKLNVLDHLIIPTSKEGSQPSSSNTTTSSSQEEEERRRRRDYDNEDYDPLRIPPSTNRRQPRSPLQEGPSLINPYPQPYNPPFGLGGQDLYPSGPGFGPTPFLPPGHTPPFGGNLIGPHHPGFGPGVVDPYNNPQFFPPPGRGGRPTPGRFPPSHPPGARFDPYGPPTGNNFSQPDPDEPPPDSYNNMFL